MADYEESPYGSGSQILSFDEENMSVSLYRIGSGQKMEEPFTVIPFDSTPEKPMHR